MINTIDKQEALESIIEENLFKTPFMVELFGDEEPEYDFDHDTRPDTDDARNRVMKAQILVEVKADQDAISKIEKDYNTYFNSLKAWAKPFEAEYYVDSILTTDNSITFVFDVPAQEDIWEPGKYLGNQEDELAENGKEIYTQDTVKVSNKKHPLYDYEGKVLSFHGEGKGKHAEVLLSNGDTEIIKVSDLKDIDSYILSLDKENLKELTETKLSAYCMDNATDKKNAMKAIDKAEGISDRTKEKAKDILVFNESWCLDDGTDQKRFYNKVFSQKNSLHTNKYITGLNLSEYSTDAPDGVLMGFDSDAGEMVSYKGKLIQKSELPKNIKIRKLKDGGELEEEIIGYNALIKFNDANEDDDPEEVFIKVGSFDEESATQEEIEEDESVFFYLDSPEEIENLKKEGVEDFIVVSAEPVYDKKAANGKNIGKFVKRKKFAITSKDQPNELFIGQTSKQITWVENWRKPILFSSEKEANEFNDIIKLNGKVVPYQKIKAADGKEIDDWKISGYGSPYIDYKLGTIHKKDDGTFMVKYGVNEVPTGAKTLAEAKSQLDKYTEEKIKEDSKYGDGGPINESDLSTLKKGFSIKWFREYLDKNFRDSFGFKINKPKIGTKAEQLIADDNFGGLKDDSLILSFPSNHGLCYSVYQGSENTYFNFVLYDKDFNGYVGGFGFKDEGDVDPEYITRFVALLMQAYGFPFTVKHTVAKNGTDIKEKGNVVIVYVPDETEYSELGGGHRNNEDMEKYIHSNSFVKQIDMSSGKSMDAGNGRIKTLKFTLSDSGYFESVQDFINDIESYVTFVGEIKPVPSKAENGKSLCSKENALMVMNNNKQIKHHSEELHNIINDKTEVPAWVVSKVNRAASDLSDAVHYLDGNKAADGSIIRADNSSLLKYVNFEDNWHINLLKLNPNRNQNGLKYKNNNKYAVSRTSDKGKRKVYEFETLEKAENKFNDLVTESKSYSNVVKEGTTSNYDTLAANGAVIGEFLEEENGLNYFKNDKGKIVITGGHGVVYDKKFDTLDEAKEHIKEENAKNPNFYIGIASNGAEISSYKKQLTEALEKKYNVSISDTGFDDTHIKLAMDKNESIDDVVSFIGNTYKLTPVNSTINSQKSSSSGKKSYICVIKDKAGNELGSYPVTHTDDKYLDDFLKAIGVKMRASDTRKIEEVEEVDEY